jgi:hypothetical protein
MRTQKRQFITSAPGEPVMAVCETALAAVSAKDIGRQGPEVQARFLPTWRSSGQRVVISVDESPTQLGTLVTIRLRSRNPFLLIDWRAGSARMHSIVEAMQSAAARRGICFNQLCSLDCLLNICCERNSLR